MPIYLANPHEELIIQRITGSDKIKTHLANLGFVVGEKVTLINKIDNNVIIKLKGVSLAVTHDLAKRILV